MFDAGEHSHRDAKRFQSPIDRWPSFKPPRMGHFILRILNSITASPICCTAMAKQATPKIHTLFKLLLKSAHSHSSLKSDQRRGLGGATRPGSLREAISVRYLLLLTLRFFMSGSSYLGKSRTSVDAPLSCLVCFVGFGTSFIRFRE